MPAIEAVESETVAIGRDLLSRARKRQPALYRGASGYLLKQTLEDAALRAAMFRLIDAMPQLAGSGALARHLAAYLEESGSRGFLPGLLKLSARPSLAWVAAAQIKRMARHFLVQETPQALAEVIAELARVPAKVSLDAVGEAVLTEAEADAYRDRVLWQMKQNWQGQAPHLSIKLTALTPRFDPLDRHGTAERIFARLAPIVATAQDTGATVTIDMEHHEIKDLIIDLFLDATATFTDQRWLPAIALQAYLPETGADIDRLLKHGQRLGRKLGVRLVKGAYWDQERAWAKERGWPMPCYTHKAATDANYERLSAKLLANADSLLPAIAGHNPRSLAHAITHAWRRGLHSEQWEIQMLHGMAEPLRDAVAEMQLPLRIYVPTGNLLTGIAYLIRRLLENTASTSVLRQAYLEDTDVDALLARPDPPINFPTAHLDEGVITEPLRDFSQEIVQHRFFSALNEVRRRLTATHQKPNLPYYASRNPARPEEVLAYTALANIDDVAAVVAAAQTAQRTWQAMPVQERVERLDNVAKHFTEQRDSLAALQVMESGKPWREADADVAEAIDFLRYYGKQALRLGGAHSTADFPGETNRFIYRPRGVAVIIAPWNFPLAILTGMTAAALLTGNAAIMKPALPGLLSAQALRDALHRAGVPPALCPMLAGGPELGQALIAHRDVHVIAFTGSRAVGLDILRAAHMPAPQQKHVKQVVCEMGGKNAIIVDEDADLDEAVVGILASAFGYSGQKCSACARVIAVGKVHDELLPRLIAAAASLQWGDPQNPACDHGPLITEHAQRKAFDYIAIGKQEARLAWQGKIDDKDSHTGWYCPPTLFTDVQPHHRIAREEIFAPVLCILRASDFQNALAMANDCDYALTGGVYSRLPEHIAMAAQDFRVGNLYLNRKITGARVGVQPFGGIALSGTGIQAGGPDYLKQFMWTQSISSNVARRGFIPDSI